MLPLARVALPISLSALEFTKLPPTAVHLSVLRSMASTTDNAVLPPRRLLFLHGMFVTPQLYQEKFSKDFFTALGDSGYECVAPCSPRPNSGPVFDMVKKLLPDEDLYPEWFNSQDITKESKVFNGLEDSLRYLIDFMNDEEPFDVVMGHSQGAMMTSILTLLSECQRSDTPSIVQAASQWGRIEKPWKAVLCMNAPNSFETERVLQSVLKSAGSPKISSAALHVFGGPTDTTWEGQQKLRNVHYPESSKVVQHEEGHMIANSNAVIEEIITALNDVVPRV
jgi:hypothetical protein